MGETYKAFLEEGGKYLKTARGGLKRPSVFTEEILYNIIGMSIEKNIMGMLIHRGEMADNHTFSDLVEALDRVSGIDGKLADDLLEYEQYQTICSVFDGYQRKKMTREVIERMIETASGIQDHAEAACGCRHE